MIPSPGFDIYETWKSKEGGRGFKVIIWGKGGGGVSHKKWGDQFLWGVGLCRHHVACTKNTYDTY